MSCLRDWLEEEGEEEGEDDIASSTLLCIRCIVSMTNAEKSNIPELHRLHVL